jgi:hypothetical protein
VVETSVQLNWNTFSGVSIHKCTLESARDQSPKLVDFYPPHHYFFMKTFQICFVFCTWSCGQPNPDAGEEAERQEEELDAGGEPTQPDA